LSQLTPPPPGWQSLPLHVNVQMLPALQDVEHKPLAHEKLHLLPPPHVHGALEHTPVQLGLSPLQSTVH
jgi:hypothetical protein